MYKAAITHINAGMAGCVAFAKHHQVARAGLAGADGLCPSAQLRHGAWWRFAHLMAVHIANQAAAVKARVWRVAAIAVGGAHQAQSVDGNAVGLFVA